MRVIILFVWLLNVAAGYYSGGIGGSGGGIGGWGGGVVSRDAPEEDVLDKSYVPNQIKLFVGHAMSGVTADEMTHHCNIIEAGAQAQLNAGGETVSDEQADAVLREMASNYPSVSPADLLNSDALTDESLRVNVALKILMNSAEEIKTMQRKGEQFGIYLKIVIRACGIIKRVSARVVDIYRLSLYDRDVKKRSLMRRKDPWSVGGTATYEPNRGWTVGGSLGYTKDNFGIKGNVNHNQHTGTSYGLSAEWKFK